MDVAILLPDRMPKRELWDYRLDLIHELSTSLGSVDVDLVILNEAPPLLAHRVLSTGVLILERSPSARVAFQVRTVNRYLDSQPMRDLYFRYLKKQFFYKTKVPDAPQPLSRITSRKVSA